MEAEGENFDLTGSAIYSFMLFALMYGLTLLPSASGGLLILVSQPLMQAIFSPGAGKLSDRIEPRVVASMGMALTALALSAFIFLDETTEFVHIVAALVVLGIGLALFSSPNTNAIMSSVEKKYYGVASGMVTTMRSVGMMTSMAISMQIFAVVMGRVQVAPDNFPQFLVSVKMIFAIFAVLCAVGVFASLARGKVR